ncbi:hypothetical protein B0G38_003730 [Arthrobacter sp. VKM Ac-2550]|nr:hypothetical protein [Arthrobacter sp. VKM Ac-2550]
MNKRPEVDAWFAERAHPLEETMQLARELITQHGKEDIENEVNAPPIHSFAEGPTFLYAESAGITHSGADVLRGLFKIFNQTRCFFRRESE